MFKIICLCFLGFMGFSSPSNATDSQNFKFESASLSSAIKKGTHLTQQEINESVDKCCGKERIMPYKESELREMVKELMNPEVVAPKYKSAFETFLSNLTPKYQELLEEGCIEPIYALLSLIVVELLPE